jgi:hypothetical protein
LLGLCLQQLPVKDRLQAGLACSTWQTAADAATDSIVLNSTDRLNSTDSAGLQALHRWLQRRGHNVFSVQLKLAYDTLLQQLPCAKLRDVHLEGGIVAWPLLPPTAASQLTRLVLQGVRACSRAEQPVGDITPSAEAAQQLVKGISSLTSLQHLVIDVCGLCAMGCAAACQALQTLHGLTHLELQQMGSALQGPQQHLSHLKNLQVLSLSFAGGEHCPAGLQHLQRLSRLSFLGRVSITQAHSSSIGRLTGLRDLTLKDCEVEAGALSDVTALQHACLQGVTWRSAAALEQWLAQQRHLTRLEGGLSYEPADIFAAVTASTTLQELDLSSSYLASAAWQHMFPAGRQLLHLHTLWLGWSGYNIAVAGAAEVASLVQCCPALRSLQACHVLPVEPSLSRLQHLTCLHALQAQGAAQALSLGSLTLLRQLKLSNNHAGQAKKWKRQDLQPLLQLPHLTNLSIIACLPAFTVSDSAAAVLKQLPGLVSLTAGMELSEAQLRGLTALTNLTYLEVWCNQLGVLMEDRLLAAGRRVGPCISFEDKVSLLCIFAIAILPAVAPCVLEGHMGGHRWTCAGYAVLSLLSHSLRCSTLKGYSLLGSILLCCLQACLHAHQSRQHV